MDQKKIDQYRKSQEEESKRKEQLAAVDKVALTVRAAAEANKAHLKNATKDIAKTSDIQEVINQLKEAQLASYLSGAQKQSVILADSTDLGEAVAGLGSKLDALAKSLSAEKSDTKLVAAVREEIAKVVKALNKDTDIELVQAIESLKPLIERIDVNPVVNVPEANVNVEIPKIDFRPLSTDIKDVAKAVRAIKQPSFDIDKLLRATQKVSEAISNLSFPVPNYVLPFKDTDGNAVQQTIELQANRVFERTSNTNGNSTELSNFTAVAGKKNYIKGYSITNTSSTNGYVDFRDGVTGSVLWTVPIPANGGANLALEDPIFWTSANTALAYDVSAALTTVYISLTGYQG